MIVKQASMSLINTESKSQIRKQMRELCRSLPTTYQQEAAIAAVKRFTQLPIFKRSKHIACYLSTAHEFSTAPLIEAIWQAKKQCYLPIVPEKKDMPLQFSHYEYGNALHLNRYAILEPVNLNELRAPEDFDIVIVPLISFDDQGHRLGTGGGYYDRTFAFLQTTSNTKPSMIGLGYAAQQVAHLPSDAWDINLNAVLTEKEFISCP